MGPVCLSIAGSDPSGGAGIQADIKTFASLGCYGASAITALTAQNTQSVASVFPVDPLFVGEQLEKVLMDMPVSAVKIGMVWQASVVEIIAKILSTVSVPIVLDPVLVSSSGRPLYTGDIIPVIVDQLIPLCAVVTPNVSEARRLTGIGGQTEEDINQMCLMITRMGAEAVLVTGGDGEGNQKADCFYVNPRGDDTPVQWVRHQAINTVNSHGTGCTLSSAITAYLAKGVSSEEAIRKGINYTTACLTNSSKLRLGSGHGGLDHFHRYRILLKND